MWLRVVLVQLVTRLTYVHLDVLQRDNVIKAQVCVETIANNHQLIFEPIDARSVIFIGQKKKTKNVSQSQLVRLE